MFCTFAFLVTHFCEPEPIKGVGVRIVFLKNKESP